MRCLTVDDYSEWIGGIYMPPCGPDQYVLLTPSEMDANTANPFRLSVADGAAVSGLIIAVWVAAHYWRALIRAISADADQQT